MPAVAIVGAQWGDEAKGRVIDLMAGRASLVVRCQGGANAGHTVVTDSGTYSLHLIPSGALRGVQSVIGHGVAVDPVGLVEELSTLDLAGIDISKLVLSDRAHLIFPYHRELDRLEEASRGEAPIGTTGRGIGPAYADKATRVGVRVCDALALGGRELVLRAANRVGKMLRAFDVEPMDPTSYIDAYMDAIESLRIHAGDAEALIHHHLSSGSLILLEGAQAALLDLDAGTYPYVTSSCTLAAGALAGSGVPPTALTACIGVYKIYPTRVGGGPFPTEMDSITDNLVREIGHEYGATTGRPRRCGWFDAVSGRYSMRMNGYTSIALTHIDVFDTLPTLKICTGYRLNGQVIDRMPPLADDLAACEPIYEEHAGWLTTTTACRTYDELPHNAKSYISRIQELIGSPISLITVGPHRDEAIELSI